MLGNFHDVSNGQILNIFTGDKLSNEIAQVLLDGGDQILNGLAKGGFQDIIKEVIKDVVSSKVVLELTNFGNDGFKQVNQKTFARFDSSLSLGNDSLDSSINLFQDSLDSRGGSSNLSINSGLDFVQEINDVILNFSRFNLGFDLGKDVLQVLDSFHDFNQRDVFLGFELVSKISKVFTNGGNEVFNGMLKGRFEDIIEKIFKNVVTSKVVLELTNLSNDGFKQVNQKTFAGFNSSLGFGNDSLDSSIYLFQDSLDSRGSSSNLSINSCLDFVQEINDVILNFSRFNLGFNLSKDVFQVLDSFHDFNQGDVFLGFELVSKICKVFTNGGDEVFNGMLNGRFEDIIEKIIKDVVSSKVVLKLTNFGNDG